MKPLDFPLFADENITPDVARGLAERGHDVRSVRDDGLVGRPDVEVLETATRQGRVVVTHDLAFGRSAIRTGASFVGIVYIRPGHISARRARPRCLARTPQQNPVRGRVRIRPPR